MKDMVLRSFEVVQSEDMFDLYVVKGSYENQKGLMRYFSTIIRSWSTEQLVLGLRKIADTLEKDVRENWDREPAFDEEAGAFK